MKQAWSEKPRKYRLEWADTDRLLTPHKSVDYDDVETFNKYLQGRTVTALEEDLEDEGAYMAHMNVAMTLDNGVELYFYGSTPCGCGCDIGGCVSTNKLAQPPLGPIETVETGGEAGDEEFSYDLSWLTAKVAGEEVALLTCSEGSSGYGDYVLGFSCTVTEPLIKNNKRKED